MADNAPYPSFGSLVREASACIGWSYNREADRRPRLDALDGLAHEAVREVLRAAAEKIRTEAAALHDSDEGGISYDRYLAMRAAARLIDPDKPGTSCSDSSATRL